MPDRGGAGRNVGPGIMLEDRRVPRARAFLVWRRSSLGTVRHLSTASLQTLPTGASEYTQTDSTYPTNSRCSCAVTGLSNTARIEWFGDMTRKSEPNCFERADDELRRSFWPRLVRSWDHCRHCLPGDLNASLTISLKWGACDSRGVRRSCHLRQVLVRNAPSSWGQTGQGAIATIAAMRRVA